MPEDPVSDDLPTITARPRQSSGTTAANQMRKVWAAPPRVHRQILRHTQQCIDTAADSLLQRAGSECSASIDCPE